MATPHRRRRRNPQPQYGTFLTAYGIYVLFLHVTPGPWKRQPSEPLLPRGAIIDTWTLTHIAWGIGARAANLPLDATIALTAANEGAETILRASGSTLLWGEPEPFLNRVMDNVATAAGWWIADQLGVGE